MPRVCEKKWRTFNREALGGLRKEIRNTPPRAPKEGGGPRAPRAAPLAKGTSKETEANQKLALLAQDRFGQAQKRPSTLLKRARQKCRGIGRGKK